MNIAPVVQLKPGPGSTEQRLSIPANTVQPIEFKVSQGEGQESFKLIQDHTGDNGGKLGYFASVSTVAGDQVGIDQFGGRETTQNTPFAMYRTWGAEPGKKYYLNVWCVDGKAHKVDLGHSNA